MFSSVIVTQTEIDWDNIVANTETWLQGVRTRNRIFNNTHLIPLADMAHVLLGNVCIVTGASRGIGRGIALQLSEAGATVYITGRNMDTLKATAKEVEGRGGRCVPVVCDSSSEEQVRSLFSQVKQAHGGRLDILVNNAYGGVQ
ncbi:dehydrogenase/reductase SDR family member 1-like, partial [Chiloscyllium plagiosum]|uniref:dehydrogenase/reductase SDR family member 1-like n=1 Tax=Chiloscyllium plagiosum TaxID=36176 RepID=UPI001CB82F71